MFRSLTDPGHGGPATIPTAEAEMAVYTRIKRALGMSSGALGLPTAIARRTGGLLEALKHRLEA